jgi:hypothetical protein
MFDAFQTICASAAYTDSDSDFLYDDEDNCPTKPNGGQQDLDGDGRATPATATSTATERPMRRTTVRRCGTPTRRTATATGRATPATATRRRPRPG